MDKFFIPYSHGTPVAIEIKGHRLVLVGTDEDTMLDDLSLVGGDTIRELDLPDDDKVTLADLAASVRGGIVMAPPGISLHSVLVDLETELPWVH